MSKKPSTTYHKSDLRREILLAKCSHCRSIVHVPVDGCRCLCGERHVRREELPGTVREKVIEG
jgi:uncharacterized OB-fold protein